jgi:hypothetical protein
VSAFVDGERSRFGVEPICQALDVSASAYYERRSGRRSHRAVEDERLLGRISELHAANYQPTATGGCGKRSAVPASRRRAAACSG